MISSWASSAVTRPRLTASCTVSSIRERVSITRPSGSISRFEIASRSSATVLAETPAASARASAALPRRCRNGRRAVRLAAPFLAAAERFADADLRVAAAFFAVADRFAELALPALDLAELDRACGAGPTDPRACRTAWRADVRFVVDLDLAAVFFAPPLRFAALLRRCWAMSISLLLIRVP